jgi:glycosyltransferase involved in cell wall biosynthesis
MAHQAVSVVLITFNEENNLQRVLKSVCWADEIIVVDSGSVDKTVEIAKQFGSKVFFNSWVNYGNQKNFAQSLTENNWVLSLDADEEVSPELKNEILESLSTVDTSGTKGFSFPRKTFYLGQWIQHGGWYPDYKVRLSDRRVSSWSEPNVHEQLIVQGQIRKLKSPLYHYSFLNIKDQIKTNLQFSTLGAVELYKNGRRFTLFKLLLKPFWKFIETFFLKKGFLDGLPGFIISVNAAHSMFLKYAFLKEAEIHDENFDR